MIDFPNTPSDGQIFTVGDTSWQYSSSVGAWLTYPYDLTLSNDLQVGNNLQVDGNGRVDGYLNAGTFFSSNDATPTFATASNYMYAGGGKFSLGEKLVFDSATPGSGGFGMLTVVGRIRGALENYEVVSLDKGSKVISNAAVSSGIATITTTAPHLFAYGDTVVVDSIGSTFSGLIGAHRVTGTSSTAFTFDIATPNISSASTTGSAKVRELTIGLHPEITSPDGGIVSPAGLGMRLDEYNYWFLNNQFRVGSASKYFRWNGSVLEVVGKITSTEGAIGGWNLASSTLTSATNAVTLDSSGVVSVGTAPDIAVLSSADAGYRLWIGNAAAAGAAFKVSKAGIVTASGATISGGITATDLIINGNITATTANITSGYLLVGSARFGINVSGTDDGLWLNAHNYWFDDGDFKVGNASQNLIWDAVSTLTVTGTVNATAGNFTGYVTAGTMRFGANVSTTLDGLWINANNYWYDTGAFNVGGATGIAYTGSGNVTIGTGVTISGTLSAATGSFSGAITSTSGTIGGWTLGPTSIHNTGGTTGMGSGATPFWAGAATPTASFAVTSTGSLKATNANITGRITATSGGIGGWTINTSTITGGNATLDSAGDLTLGTGNNVVRLSATDASYRLWAGNTAGASSNFAVSTTGILTATSAVISGTLTATAGTFTGAVNASSGTIGGWTISPSAIHNSAGTTGMGSGATPFWAGGATPSSTFVVTSTGSMRATNAVLSGSIIGGTIDIGGNDTSSFHVDSSGKLWMGGSAYATAPLRISAEGYIYSSGLTILRDDDPSFQATSFYSAMDAYDTTYTDFSLDIPDGTYVSTYPGYMRWATYGVSDPSAITKFELYGPTAYPNLDSPSLVLSSFSSGDKIVTAKISSGSHTIMGGTEAAIFLQSATPGSDYESLIYYTANVHQFSNQIAVNNIRISSSTDASASSTAHGFQVGSTSSANLIIDNNEIMARNAGATSTLILNGDGGTVSMSNAKLVILDTGKLGVGGSPTYYLDVTTSGGRLALDSTASTNVTLGTGNNAHTIRISGGIPDAASDGGAIQLYGNGHSTQASKIIFDTDGTEITRFNATGEILIGKTTDAGAYLLQVNSQIWATNATVATSDERLKENIEPLSDGLESILLLRPVSFEWKEQQDIVGSTGKILENKFNFPEGKQIGFIAQDVEKALKDKEWVDSIVTCDRLAPVYDIIIDEDGEEVYTERSLREQDTIYGVAEGHIIPLLVKAVQELSFKVDELQDKLKK